jgi:hypothetical protein
MGTTIPGMVGVGTVMAWPLGAHQRPGHGSICMTPTYNTRCFSRPLMKAITASDMVTYGFNVNMAHVQ